MSEVLETMTNIIIKVTFHLILDSQMEHYIRMLSCLKGPYHPFSMFDPNTVYSIFIHATILTIISQSIKLD
ncbi:hypothetical protein LDENG_00256120 [Lucifuga dentata]|nr:hypothetical protein LDENG_00256120 [Lucifuga dentata]